MAATLKTYVSESCGGTFEYEDDWTDDDAVDEYEAMFHEKPTTGKDVIVCDDCYKAIVGLN